MVRFSLIGSPAGQILEVILNESNDLALTPGNSFIDYVDTDSHPAILRLTHTLVHHPGSFSTAEVNLRTASSLMTVLIGGCLFRNKLVLIGSSHKALLPLLWYHTAEELRRQGKSLGKQMLAQRIALQFDELDHRVLDEVSRINNELVNAQRELAKRTVELERLRQQLEMLAVTDNLTQLLNRRGLELHVQREIERAQRNNSPLSVVMFDIDRFKSINDTWGHKVGDEVLAEVGRRTSSVIRGVDIAVRYGGDEFLILLPETTLSNAALVANRLKDKLTQPLSLSCATLHLSISAGVACDQGPGIQIDKLIEKADALLYKAKNQGRNQICVEDE